MLGTQFLRKATIKESQKRVAATQPLIEPLEGRTLLSATASSPLFDLERIQAQGASSTNSGYIPSQIASAYGYDKISFDNGTVAANGAGQTIAIIDAAGDPNIQADLTTFDESYGLPAPPSFTEISQRGLTTDVPTNNPEGWDGEISLDVEWAHATAPGANILLVVTDDQTPQDFMAGIQAAEKVPSVSVITMSFGIPPGQDGLTTASELAFDSSFKTPAGHQGITFLASAGDSGAVSGINWPAESPNVISVGGTSLSIDQYGDYEGESTWGNSSVNPQNGSEPSVSAIEPEPAYQEGVQQTGNREVADVSYNADPSTGFAVYDSVSVADGNEGEPGWGEVGGTSAAAPSWAGLIAIADQGRALEGLDTLDGPSQTLPLLYSVYSAPGTAGYSNYTSYFNDVTVGGAFYTPFSSGGVGYGLTSSAVGWDPVTGLGSPKVPAIVDLLDTPPAPPGPTGTAGNGAASGTITWTADETLAPSPLSASIPTKLPAYALDGQAGSVRLTLTDTSGVLFQGPVSVALDISANGSADTPITTFTYPKIRLGAGRSVSELLRFHYPTGVTGNFFLVAFVSATATQDASTSAVSSTAINIAPPNVDLTSSFASTSPVLITPGQNSVYITITNDGNLTAAGTLSLALYASADGALDSSDTLLTSFSNRPIRIGARQSIRIRLVFQSPDNLVGGTFDLISSISSSTSPADTDTSDKTATIGTTAS